MPSYMENVFPYSDFYSFMKSNFCLTAYARFLCKLTANIICLLVSLVSISVFAKIRNSRMNDYHTFLKLNFRLNLPLLPAPIYKW